jgi:hypothetical protein
MEDTKVAYKPTTIYPFFEGLREALLVAAKQTPEADRNRCWLVATYEISENGHDRIIGVSIKGPSDDDMDGNLFVHPSKIFPHGCVAAFRADSVNDETLGEYTIALADFLLQMQE